MNLIAIDLFCGLGGWTEGLLDEGFDVIGFDIERQPYKGHRVIQDVMTIHGRQFKDAACIVASPPCQAYSYRAMPWKKAKALPPPSNDLFDACFRIQREASEAAGRYIPMVVENVCGAQRWVGRAKWHYGSYYLWGDVPALMPPVAVRRTSGDRSTIALKGVGGSWDRSRPSHNSDHGWKRAEAVASGNPKGTGAGSWFFKSRTDPRDMRRNEDGEWTRMGIKQPGIGGVRKNGKGDGWFQDGAARHGSRSDARKQASAMIAKIPYALAWHIAKYMRQYHEHAPAH